MKRSYEKETDSVNIQYLKGLNLTKTNKNRESLNEEIKTVLKNL